jgi:uncharacterized protein
MKPRAHDPLALDVPSLCREGAALAGRFALAELPRFAQSLWSGDDAPPGDAGGAQWQAEASLRRRRGGDPQCVFALRAQATATLRCQRCLAPMTLPLELQRRYAFADSEDEAAEADADNDDEDVLALTRRLDLRELLEDELILALPLVPRHEVCPEPLPLPVAAAPADAEAEVPHPFAALAALRSGGVKSGR